MGTQVTIELRLFDASASNVDGTVAIPLNQLVRIEWRIVHSNATITA